MAVNLEIERKFLVDDIPGNLHELESHYIRQGYLACNDQGQEIRVRQKDNRYYLTAKSGRGLQREEINVEIEADVFNSLWPLTEGKRVEKIRYEIIQGFHTIELDVFRNGLQGLLIVEVEFESEKDSRKFEIPSWFGKEVTTDERFKNRNLAVKGIGDLPGIWKKEGRPAWHYHQSGVLPLKDEKGSMIMLVTSHSGKSWVIPKGIIEPGLSPRDSAVKEAFEEAGIKGEISVDPVIRYKYEKWSGSCDLSVYLMVTRQALENWPEAGTRKRCWFEPAEAAARIKHKELREYIEDHFLA